MKSRDKENKLILTLFLSIKDTYLIQIKKFKSSSNDIFSCLPPKLKKVYKISTTSK